MYKVEGNSELVRDPKTGAILNSSREAYSKAMKQRKVQQQNKERMDSLESKVDTLNNDIQEIKSLLRSISDNNK